MNAETGDNPIVHMVGSLPLADAASAFRAVADSLGAHMRRIPDGETGRRARWISFINDQLKAHPDLEADPTIPPFEFKQWDGKPVYVVDRLRVKAGRDPAALRFATGYADDAIRNHGDFKRLKEDGVIPTGMKYQICMATPLAITYNFISPKAYDAFLPAYTRHLTEELERIAAALPHGDISYQWDVCQEVLMWEGYFDQPAGFKDQIVTTLGAIGDLVPRTVDLGYHLCYGSPRDEHLVQPRDMAVMVEIANGLLDAAGRPVQYIHMPVPRDRNDEAYFSPLDGLRLPAGTALYLGLVHEGDPQGNAAKLAAARRHVPVAGVAAECGLGRGDPDTLTDVLEQHRLLAEAG